MRARANVQTLAEEVIAQLHVGEPNLVPHSAFILMLHENEHGALNCVSASSAATSQSPRAKRGALWKKTSPNELSAEAFSVVQKGE
eukprot:5888560-Prymnesium_polylepis.1